MAKLKTVSKEKILTVVKSKILLFMYREQRNSNSIALLNCPALWHSDIHFHCQEDILLSSRVGGKTSAYKFPAVELKRIDSYSQHKYADRLLPGYWRWIKMSIGHLSKWAFIHRGGLSQYISGSFHLNKVWGYHKTGKSDHYSKVYNCIFQFVSLR